MSVANAYAPAMSGPSEARLAFLRKVALMTAGGLAFTAVVAVVSMFTVAPIIMSLPFGALIGVLGSFFFAHYFCRGLVYGDKKLLGFFLGTAAEGFSFGFLLLSTIFYAGAGGVQEGLLIVVKGMAITASAGVGMLIYVWFNKSDLSYVRGALTTLGLPMLVLMGLQFVFPVGGVIGLAICGVFVVFSAGSLLYALNTVVHEMDEDMHVEAAFEITMKMLVLLWNVIQLLNRLRR